MILYILTIVFGFIALVNLIICYYFHHLVWLTMVILALFQLEEAESKDI